ncbi:MAG: hypothetical protein JOZ53_18635, partial [Planctomycetaceae bacterium]|nr:hypothetical protein [Planctomycetaceae bacterium]
MRNREWSGAGRARQQAKARGPRQVECEGTRRRPARARTRTRRSAAGSTENRYLFVTARFDPALVPPPPAPAARPVALPDDPFLKDPKDPKRIDEEKKAKEKVDRDQADYDRRVGDGRKRVKELTDRFAGWYYVT